MTWFAKLALATKILVVPVVFVIALGIVLGASLSAIDQQQAAIEQQRATMDQQKVAVERHRAAIEGLGNIQVEALVDIAGADDALTQAHLSLHDLMMTAVNEYDTNKINARSQDTNEKLEAIVSAFATLDFSGLDNADLVKLRADAITHASAYQAAAFATADMAPLDVGSAGIILKDATRLYETLADDVKQLTRTVEGLRVARADTAGALEVVSAGDAEARRQFVEIATAAGGVGLVLILLICGQVIGRFAGMARSAAALCEQITGLEKTVSRQKDEIGRKAKTRDESRVNAAEVKPEPSGPKNADRGKVSLAGKAATDQRGDIETGTGSLTRIYPTLQSVPDTAVSLYGGAGTDISDPVKAEVTPSEEAFQGLVDAAIKNHEVVEFISEIAEQANLRALNATLEAAKDGDTGRRYAALAAEARNLAEQASSATGENRSHVKDMRSATGEAFEAAKSITKIIGRITAITQTMTGVWEAGQSYEDIAKAASETGDAAREVLEVAIDLSEHAQTLNDQVESCMAEGRAA